MADIYSIGAATVGAGGTILGSLLNNDLARRREAEARRENYKYNEMSADNADRRTRALYSDFYSPQALMRQYQEAGLSPSLMFGGTPGQGGMSGAQAASSAVQPTTFGVDITKGLELGLMAAQVKKLNAETQNIETDTARADIQKGIEELQSKAFKEEFNMLQLTVTYNGKNYSLAELAKDFWDYNSYLQEVRNIAEQTKDTRIQSYLSTELGQKTLRSIYTAANRFERDITVLGSEKTSADFQKQIVEAMNNTQFAQLNAQGAVQYLKTNIEASKLSEQQNKAWNNLLDKLGKQGSTTKDILIVLGMIVNRAMSQWHMPSVKP